MLLFFLHFSVCLQQINFNMGSHFCNGFKQNKKLGFNSPNKNKKICLIFDLMIINVQSKLAKVNL